jgi:tetratricopeptide (TPR) repeat protein
MMLQPIAFMVMPFGSKPVVMDRPDANIPATVNFDLLWERVYEPALVQLGYEAVRADYDLGSLIINDMIQRLAAADLVLADVTLPNANVYYEIGVRHAAKGRGCVLVAADWSKPTFDVEQMRQSRFPLPDGQIPEAYADEAVKTLVGLIRPRIEGTSPVFDAVPGYPDNIDEKLLPSFRSAVAKLASFDAEVRAVSHLPEGDRPQAARDIVARQFNQPVVRDAIAVRLSWLLRETATKPDDWQFLLDYIDRLPDHLAARADVLERRAFALGKKGEFAAAAGLLEELIASHGATSERYGLLGGRYKDLMRVAHLSSDRQRYLNMSIESYDKGMRLDLNDYYPASNLPRLYRQRRGRDDLLRADEAAVIATEGCRRAIALGLDNEWTRATLLGMAFYRGDVTAARKLKKQVEMDGPNAWKLESTLKDLRGDIEQHTDPKVRGALTVIVKQLEVLQSQVAATARLAEPGERSRH